MTPPRPLTDAQAEQLEALFRTHLEDDRPVVVGWYANGSAGRRENGGPILRFPDGDIRWISLVGRLCKVPPEVEMRYAQYDVSEGDYHE